MDGLIRLVAYLGNELAKNKVLVYPSSNVRYPSNVRLEDTDISHPTLQLKVTENRTKKQDKTDNLDVILSCYVRLNVLYDGISELGW